MGPEGQEAALDVVTEIETPEQVRFRHRLAGPTRRALAYLLDALIRAGIVLVIALPIVLVAGFGGGDARGLAASSGLVLLVLFVVEWGYYVAWESLWNGQTPGRRALGLRVVKEGGQPIGFTDSVLRNLLRAADFLPWGYFLGLVVASADPKFRRLGDWVAGTLVVHERQPALLRARRRGPDGDPALVAALPARPHLTPGELEALELFVQRRELSPERRAELAAMLAPLFAARFGLAGADPVALLEALHARATARARELARG